ncbi:MAG: class I SAM-dependent methyltransferase [Verrucomicrobiota bacterium]
MSQRYQLKNNITHNQSLEALYDSKHAGYFEYSRPEMLPFVPESARKILDVGCGAAGFSGTLKKLRPVEVWGVELNKSASEVARGRIDKVFHAPFGPELDLPRNYFDVICFNDVLEHFADPGSVLRHAKTLLAPEGCIVASIPNFRFFDNMVKIIVRKSARYVHEGIMDRAHLRIFTKSSIALLFDEAEMAVERVEGINSQYVSNKFAFFNVLTLGWISDMRFLQFAVVAKSKPHNLVQKK